MHRDTAGFHTDWTWGLWPEQKHVLHGGQSQQAGCKQLSVPPFDPLMSLSLDAPVQRGGAMWGGRLADTGRATLRDEIDRYVIILYRNYKLDIYIYYKLVHNDNTCHGKDYIGDRE